MEKNPWWSSLQGPLPSWDGKPVGVKRDGGGSIRGQGRIGPMRLHRAAHNKDAAGGFVDLGMGRCLHGLQGNQNMGWSRAPCGKAPGDRCGSSCVAHVYLQGFRALIPLRLYFYVGTLTVTWHMVLPFAWFMCTSMTQTPHKQYLHFLLYAHPAIRALVESGDDVNEVEAAGNTPLHAAAFEGWAQGVKLLLQLGAKVGCDHSTCWLWSA